MSLVYDPQMNHKCMAENCTKGFKYRARLLIHWPTLQKFTRQSTNLYLCGEHKQKYKFDDIVPESQWKDIIKDLKKENRDIPDKQTSSVEFQRV